MCFKMCILCVHIFFGYLSIKELITRKKIFSMKVPVMDLKVYYVYKKRYMCIKSKRIHSFDAFAKIFDVC